MSQASDSHSSHSGNSDTSEFFGGTIPSASFEEEGDSIRGTVVAKELRLATKDDGTGNMVVDRWDDGRPKKIAVLTLRTLDAQEINLFVRGYMQPAFIETLKFMDLKDVQIGADIRVTWSSTDEPKRKGFNGAKHYTVDYAEPGERLVDLLSEQEKEEPADEPPF
jgi:hypothetical protein